MFDPGITVEQFRALAPGRLHFLEDYGFRRRTDIEETLLTSSSLVYLGRNLGFVISLDVREQCVDAEVVKVQSGKVFRTSDGGYSSDLFAHLVEHSGFRGKPPLLGESSGMSNSAALCLKIDAWANLLRTSGQSLLFDKAGSLPE